MDIGCCEVGFGLIGEFCFWFLWVVGVEFAVFVDRKSVV